MDAALKPRVAMYSMVLPLASGRWWAVIDDDYGLRLLAGENERNDPTDERDTKRG